MAKENKKEVAEVKEATLSKTEIFLNRYKNALLIALCVILVAGAASFCWYKFAYQPKVAEGQGQMAAAEQNFRAGDWELALNGDGNALGFIQIIDEYGSKAGKSVYFYAGVCELQLGQYAEAVKHLNAYKGSDEILAARAKACLGDAYVGLEDYAKALKCFEEAANVVDNMYAAGYLLKAGAVAEKLGKNDKALECYKTIKDQYPTSMEAYEIDKYIGRLEAK
ncbi:MAG: tol-pal system YbgF family protein [Candidatus Cryptobacteroides sp.]